MLRSQQTLSLCLLFLATVLTAVNSNADMAPQPQTLKLVAYYDIGAERYREIEVACNNRSEVTVYKRERQREWCVGGPGSGECFKDNMGAAKRACAESVTTGLAER